MWPPEFGLRQVSNSSRTYEAIYRLISKNTPESQPSARARIIKAGEFSAGNVVLDESAFGAGIGVVTSPKYPAFAEYKVTLPAGGEQEIWLRYASAEPRPVALSLNGKPVNRSACPEATGGFHPAEQNWCKAGRFPMQQGVNTIRLDTTGPFPHIEKLAVSPPGATR